MKIGKQYVEYYNQYTDFLKNGKLYLEKDLLEKSFQEDSSEIRTFYPYSYEVVDTKRIRELIEQKEEKAYYCVVDGNQSLIFEAASGNIIYCNLDMKPVYEISRNTLRDIVDHAKK
jgi:hypothetical protein